MKKYKIKHNPEKCNGCQECVKACARNHGGLNNCDIFEVKGKFYYFSCLQCGKPQCAGACPVGALRKNEVAVILQLELCIGCKNCIEACPFGVPKYNENLGKINKCDLCVDRVRAGKLPYCVEACPNQALEVVYEQPKPKPKPKAKEEKKVEEKKEEAAK